jgi:hypothetical protein
MWLAWFSPGYFSLMSFALCPPALCLVTPTGQCGK